MSLTLQFELFPSVLSVLLAGKAPRLYNTENGFIFSFTFQCPSEPACMIKCPGILISHSDYCYYYN